MKYTFDYNEFNIINETDVLYYLFDIKIHYYTYINEKHRLVNQFPKSEQFKGYEEGLIPSKVKNED